ncbi:hypothetical protein T4B_14413 [Trichinella pseudospiralis]|uniref:Uncharacterized protein n=1 Tax=Trichinella pseudospiralis TaxID=6337 RepID=A0A0V1GA56_TRIPS|nr:hypothetical protein T4B_14413 [Trichinella pseudospiralis]
MGRERGARPSKELSRTKKWASGDMKAEFRLQAGGTLSLISGM